MGRVFESWTSLLACAALFLTALPAAAKKKEKASDRLKTLTSLYVEGPGRTSEYVRRNLEGETCLVNAADPHDADAVLDLQEFLRPCQDSPMRMCTSLTAVLRDAATDKPLWTAVDDNLPAGLTLGGGLDTAGKWVLWRLKGACCDGRAKVRPKAKTP